MQIEFRYKSILSLMQRNWTPRMWCEQWKKDEFEETYPYPMQKARPHCAAVCTSASKGQHEKTLQQSGHVQMIYDFPKTNQSLCTMPRRNRSNEMKQCKFLFLTTE